MTYITYGLLYLTVILLWVPKITKIPFWIISLLLAILFGLMSNRLDKIAIIYILLLAMTAFVVQNQKLFLPMRFFSGIILLILGFSLEMHIAPGFHNLKILDHIQISSDAVPFTLYLNFDKAVVGIFILGILHQRITTKDNWLRMLKITVPSVLILFCVMTFLSLIFKYVHFDFKIPTNLVIWGLTNLLFVCVAEEALFRGFIQKYLCMILSFKYGNFIAIIIAATLFGLTHYSGGITYIYLATIAGLGYGWIYLRTNRIEASILTHFVLNLTHVLCFTYPALKST
jgi:membrane protease YdiL (CAAX protease family)